MIGKSVLHYRITEKLGEGGMGVVFKAEDTRLKRDVAIKFLPRHLAAATAERKRFETEARAAASLNHPNVGHVYAIEEADGEMFIVMEYVRGSELRELIGGQLSLERTIDLAGQVAAGLQAAHGKGVVHRDIKSANIMVADQGLVKIMDFGLAKVRGSTRVTRTGMTVGTTEYMSPEQLRGDEVDQRTDIWSFGVVLYEMLTGERPFRGDYEQAIMYAIMNEDPRRPSALRAALPPEADRLVEKALARERDDRYQRMDDVIRDLESLRGVVSGATAGHRAAKRGSPRSELPALAVLPFASIRNDPESDFLGFALADQIIGALTYVDRIVVRASSAIRKYQNQAVDVSAAARELHADFVLAGHYLKEADTVRLNVELVTAESNDLLWRESIEVKYENTFQLQDIVAKKVLRGLKVQFPKAAKVEMQADVPANPVAYEYYLRGVSYSTTLADNRLAIGMLEKAIKVDPDYAPAHAELGYRLAQEAAYGLLGDDAHRRAEGAMQRALSLNKNQLRALWSLANLYIEFGRHEEAVGLIQRMLRVTPNNAMAHFVLGYLCRYTGMLEESIAAVEKALALDPRNQRFRSAGFTYVYNGDYRKAYEAFQLDDKSAPPIAWQGLSLLLMGEKDRAIERLDRAIAMEPGPFVVHRFGAIRASIAGETERGLQLLHELEEIMPPHSDAEHWYAIADTYGLLGDRASCVRALQRGIDGGFFNYPAMLKNPWLAPYRDDPEFQRALEKARGKHEAFRKSTALQRGK